MSDQDAKQVRRIFIPMETWLHPLTTIQIFILPLPLGTNMLLQTSLCHCQQCRKISGATYSVNLTVPVSDFSLTRGELKKYRTKHPEAGFEYSLSFCPECSTPVYAEVHPSEGAPAVGTVVLQVGTLDDPTLLEHTPAEEMNINHRVQWSAPIPSAKQKRTYVD
jgi:hypothetical protein